MEQKYNELLPKRGNPEQETVYCKIGGTIYEVSISCGATERLQDKIIRLMKSENSPTPDDK